MQIVSTTATPFLISNCTNLIYNFSLEPLVPCIFLAGVGHLIYLPGAIIMAPPFLDEINQTDCKIILFYLHSYTKVKKLKQSTSLQKVQKLTEVS